MTNYRNNHYVPIWYQERFISDAAKERKFHYLDLRPETVTRNNHTFRRNELLNWGPKNCFCQEDLYTTRLGSQFSTAIEQEFFGLVDQTAPAAVDYFTNFTHPSADHGFYRQFLLHLSLQKLRTPKGLKHLALLSGLKDTNALLREMQRLRALFCAIWTESIWTIATVDASDTGFLVSDHPVTVYNQGCFPASRWCRDGAEPDIWLSGTHTLFPLRPDRILILTNLSWVRHPYGNPVKNRPNPNPLRPAMFNFSSIQTGRSLSPLEVAKINYIIKARALRYVAAEKREWLYPEKIVGRPQWDSFGKEYLLMPDPRSVTFSTKIVMGFAKGGSDSFDEYGRKAWDKDFEDPVRMSRDWETFHAFQGEYARLFGPYRRGRSFEFARDVPERDSDDYHNYHLTLEKKNRKHRYAR